MRKIEHTYNIHKKTFDKFVGFIGETLREKDREILINH